MKNDQEKQIKELKERIAGLEMQIRDMKEIEIETKVNEDNFRDIIETFRYGIVYTTLSGEVITINKNLEKLVEIKADDLVGKNIVDLAQKYVDQDTFIRILPGLKSLITGNNITPFQVEFRNKILEIIPNINFKRRRLTAIFRDVTESARIQNELKASEARLRRAELASRSGNWELQLDTGIIYGSEGARMLYGIKDFHLEYSKVRTVPLPEYRMFMDKALEDLVKYDKPYNIEFKIKNAETGQILDIHSIAEYDKSKRTLFGVIQDITERKINEEEIKLKNLELARFLDITLDLMETVDKDIVLRRIVEGAVSLIGLDTGAIYLLDGENIFLEVTTPPLPVGFPDELRRALISQHPRIRDAVENNRTVIENDISEVEQTDAEKIVIEARQLRSLIYVPLIVQKVVKGVLIIGTSGNKHIFTEHEIDLTRTLSNIASLTLENTTLFNNLTLARDKARESDKLKTAFLHNISHEIRTPLNAIVGFSGFLEQPDLTEKERREYIDIIYQSNNQLLSIISDILNIAQIETGQVVLKESVFDISVLVKNLHRQFLPEAGKKGLEFRYNPPSGITEGGSMFFGDESKLIQILSNLLSNALKFTHEGYIELDWDIKDGMWQFTISDTGIGILPGEQEKIFDRFYQVSNINTKSFGGTGLGLTISRAFAMLMGGKLELVSVFGKGSSFTLSIPHHKPVGSVKIPEKQFIRAPQENHRKNTIIVAEDEDSNFYLINVILRPLGYNIIRALNGMEAVDLCHTIDPDIILMDIKMPVLDGLSATQEILKFKPDLKIIAQSAYAHSADKEKAMQAGCIDYVSKPFSKETLLGIINRYLG